MRVLLVEDSPHHRQAGIEQLAALGHEVVALSDYWEARQRAVTESFDIALIDLLMPVEATTLSPEARKEFFDREVAIGFPLVLELTRLGIKKVAVAADMNQQDHPMSGVVDWFNATVLAVNAAKVLIMHAPMCQDGSKDWAKVLHSIVT